MNLQEQISRIQSMMGMINESSEITDDVVGKEFWFEYHCFESPKSCDAELWYRTHNKVLVLSIVELGCLETKLERLLEGCPRVYRVVFEDGFEYVVFEDELMESKEEFERPDAPKRNIQESIRRILKEETNKNDIKSILFNILSQSEYVQKFDYVWSPNLSVGSPIIFINDLSERDFFDKKTNIFDLIGEYWPYGKKDYEDWKDLYYGLVYGYVIKDKNSDTKILVQVIRFDDGFKIYLNPNYKKEIEGDKIFIDDEMINVFTSGENTYSNNDFTFLGIELKDKLKTINDMKNIFNYLDALI